MPTIRFCGGPWHNRLQELDDFCPAIVVQCVQPQTTLSYAGCFKAADIKRDKYFLASYFTNYGTKYYQYVHESLISDGHASPVTWKERTPVWRISRRELESRLRRAMKR